MSFTTKQNVHDVTQASEVDLDKAIQEATHFDPAYDRILLKREKSALERRMNKSSLIVADTVGASYVSSEGYLIKCGPTVDKEAIALVGKKVLFSKYSGEDIIITQPDGSKAEFVLATDSDIFGELK